MKEITDDEICNMIYDNIEIVYKDYEILNMRMYAETGEEIPTIVSIVTYAKDNKIYEKIFINKLIK